MVLITGRRIFNWFVEYHHLIKKNTRLRMRHIEVSIADNRLMFPSHSFIREGEIHLSATDMNIPGAIPNHRLL